MDGRDMTIPLDQWEAPVFQAMHRVPTLAGVPMGFFVADCLGTLFAVTLTATVWDFLAALPVLLLGGLLYGLAWLGTQYEPRWLAMLWEYLSYNGSYEA